MGDFYKCKILPNLVQLTKTLLVSEIQQELLQEKLISPAQDEILREVKRTSTERATYFLNDLLPYWPLEDYLKFCSIIIESADTIPKHKTVASLLQLQMPGNSDGASPAKTIQSQKYGSSAGKHDKEDSRDEVDGPLEKKIGPDSLTEERVRREMEKAGKAVCLIKGQSRATGFLVGRDLVFTCNHVIDSCAAAKRATFTFNYTDSSKIDDRPTFKFKPGGLFLTDSDLDFSLIQLQSKTTEGSEPVVDLAAAKLPDTMNRLSMLNAVKDPSLLNRDTGVYILHHPSGRARSLSCHGTLKDVPDKGRWLLYPVSTEPASSGSPVFNQAFRLIGMHRGRTEGEANQGIFIGAVIRKLESMVENYHGFGDDTGEKATLESFLSSFGE